MRASVRIPDPRSGFRPEIRSAFVVRRVVYLADTQPQVSRRVESLRGNRSGLSEGLPPALRPPRLEREARVCVVPDDGVRKTARRASRAQGGSSGSIEETAKANG